MKLDVEKVKNRFRAAAQLLGLPLDSSLQISEPPPISDVDFKRRFFWRMTIGDRWYRSRVSLHVDDAESDPNLLLARSFAFRMIQDTVPSRDYQVEAELLHTYILPVTTDWYLVGRQRQSEKTLLNDIVLDAALAPIRKSVGQAHQLPDLENIPTARQALDSILAELRDRLLPDLEWIRKDIVESLKYEIEEE